MVERSLAEQETSQELPGFYLLGGIGSICDDLPMPLALQDETLICRHFGTCGGCSCPVITDEGPRPLPYREELITKEERIRTLLAAYDVESWLPIIPSPDIWHYRNKMEYAFGNAVEADLVLGLRQAGRFDRLVDIETCSLMSPGSLELLKCARQWARDHGLKGYDRRRHSGDLRYLVIRETKNTDQRLAIVIASKGSPIDQTETQEALLADFQKRIEPLATTAWLGMTDARGDVARTNDMRKLWGPGVMEERLRGLRFQISPYSFFQTNPHGTEKLYGLLAEWGARVGGTLLDLYCGSGGITLSLAKSFDRVIGVDTNREAIEDAKLTSDRNGIQNAEFVFEDALEFLKKLPASKFSVQLSAVIVDPPRPGLHPKALESLLELNPPRIAYVSCNPESLARDLKSLAPLYRITSVQPVDLFPHTQHVETLALLEHR